MIHPHLVTEAAIIAWIAQTLDALWVGLFVLLAVFVLIVVVLSITADRDER